MTCRVLRTSSADSFPSWTSCSFEKKLMPDGLNSLIWARIVPVNIRTSTRQRRRIEPPRFAVNPEEYQFPENALSTAAAPAAGGTSVTASAIAAHAVPDCEIHWSCAYGN